MPAPPTPAPHSCCSGPPPLGAPHRRCLRLPTVPRAFSVWNLLSLVLSLSTLSGPWPLPSPHPRQQLPPGPTWAHRGLLHATPSYLSPFSEALSPPPMHHEDPHPRHATRSAQLEPPPSPLELHLGPGGGGAHGGPAVSTLGPQPKWGTPG